MGNKGELESNIARLKGYKKKNLSRMDEARTSTEEKHFRMLASKNQEQIDKYEERLKA